MSKNFKLISLILFFSILFVSLTSCKEENKPQYYLTKEIFKSSEGKTTSENIYSYNSDYKIIKQDTVSDGKIVKSEAYTYNDLGYRSHIDYGNYEEWFIYDNKGRVIEQTTSLYANMGVPEYKKYYEYIDNNNSYIVTSTEMMGSSENTTYINDKYGNLEKIIDSTGKETIYKNTYEGKLLKKTVYSNGSWLEYSHDANDNVVKITRYEPNGKINIIQELVYSQYPLFLE